jgi:hypothetical protein
MRRSLLILCAVAAPLTAQQQQSRDANPGLTAAKGVWMIAHDFVMKTAEQVPESLYSFRPTPEVRSLGGILGHVADAERMLCNPTGNKLNFNPVNEKLTTKAEIIKALKDAAASCDAAYAMADAAATAAPIDFFGRPANRMFVAQFNGAHTMEHYGNLVTYMRLKKITPPSSQPSAPRTP